MRENARRPVVFAEQEEIAARFHGEKLDIRSFGEQVALLKRRFATATSSLAGRSSCFALVIDCNCGALVRARARARRPA